MIVHFDLDAFYASVAQRDDPSLRGVPLAISGSSRRAVVLTASYEARPFGVRSAMPLYRALELCPHLTVVPPNFTAYRESSHRVFGIFADGARAVEGLSLDEAFVDVPTDDLDETIAFAQRVRARIREEVGLTASAGVATVKMVAKIASDANKPDGLTVVPPGTEAAYLAPMPVGRLWGIGPKTQPRLERAGIRTIADVAALDDSRLYDLFGRAGTFYRDLARGIDDREVDPSRERKSLSTEETFEYDERDESRILALLRVQADELARDLQKEQLRGATVGVKIKKADHTVTGRQTSLAVATNDADAIHDAAVWCWHRSGMRGVPIRLLGTRIASLTDEEAREIRLF
ncbi:MAG: putative polymerase [Candidatus Eremiobacteraeota bacterium]|nr:putative polymerase [Candidatus Eremiobacteraeota bacterium]